MYLRQGNFRGSPVAGARHSCPMCAYEPTAMSGLVVERGLEQHFYAQPFKTIFVVQFDRCF